MDQTTRSQKLTIKINQNERLEMEKQAAQMGFVSRRSGRPVLSKYIREKIFNQEDVLIRLDGLDELAASLNNLRKIGINLNTAVRLAHEVNYAKRREDGHVYLPTISYESLETFIQIAEQLSDKIEGVFYNQRVFAKSIQDLQK